MNSPSPTRLISQSTRSWSTDRPAIRNGSDTLARTDDQGSGWQTTDGDAATVGVHERGRGPGDTASLPYFSVDDLPASLEQVERLGGSVIHSGARFAICRDSEGSPFGLAGPDSEG